MILSVLWKADYVSNWVAVTHNYFLICQTDRQLLYSFVSGPTAVNDS